jgi:hypothetical protein
MVLARDISISLVGEQPAARPFLARNRNFLLQQRRSLCFATIFQSTKMTTAAPVFAPAKSCSTTWVNALQEVSIGVRCSSGTLINDQACYPDMKLANTVCPQSWKPVDSEGSITTCCPK